MHSQDIAKCQMGFINRRQKQIIRHYLARTLNYKSKRIIQQHCDYYGITIEQFNEWLRRYMKHYKDDRNKYIQQENMQNEMPNPETLKPRKMRRRVHNLAE